MLYNYFYSLYKSLCICSVHVIDPICNCCINSYPVSIGPCNFVETIVYVFQFPLEKNTQVRERLEQSFFEGLELE